MTIGLRSPPQKEEIMTVIAMTREMGSGGREVAQRLADQNGLQLVLHELVEQDLAEHMHVRESAVHHRLEGGATMLERLQIGSRRLARYTEEEVLDLAQKGNVVIRGWGACVLLRGVPHIARVRVCAPMGARERAVMQRHGIKDLAAARREIQRNDAAHRRTLLAAYGVDREDPLLYDLVLNTERTPIETCVKLVRELVESPAFAETARSRTILEDRVLEAHIRIKLRERFTVGTGVTGIAATVTEGKVVLTGTAIHPVLAADACRIAGAIAGVKDVQNSIDVVRGPRAFG
jgi:cytidylate kinase